MNQKTLPIHGRHLFAMLLAVLMTLGTFLTSQISVYAASGTLYFNSGETLAYGDYFTTKMTFDGFNTAYCAQPMKSTPAAGSYEYDLLGKGSDVRKALYYLPGGYGYASTIKASSLSGWSANNAYVIGHLAVSYLYAGRDAGSGAFYGAPQSYIDKTIEVVSAIDRLPAAPDAFKAFVIPSDSRQTIVGSWYEVPNGWIEIVKNSANTSLTKDNSNYSLKGAVFEIYLKDKLVDTLTTNKDGYAKSKELEADKTYTVKETKASPGFAVDATAHDAKVTTAATSTVKISEVPQNNPMDILLQKVDADTGGNSAQGTASLENAEFTVKYYTQQSDTDPAADGAKPERTWIFKTNAEGKIAFTKDFLLSGDKFYYQMDGKTVCLPLGTVTVQETKAPSGYHVNSTIFVQPIREGGTAETVSSYNTSIVPDSVFRGGVRIQKRDAETGTAKPQGAATLQKSVFTITTLNEMQVSVEGTVYDKDQVVLTLETDENGLAATAPNALPVGHYRIDEITPPGGYLNEGQTSLEFDIVTDGDILDLTAEKSSISNYVIRGGVKIQKRDLETGNTEAQGNGSLEKATFTITTLNDNPVLVDGVSYTRDQVVLTLKTDENGLTSTAENALPYGHYRVDEITPPSGYLKEGAASLEFDIVNHREIVDLSGEDTSIHNQIIRGDLEFVKVSDGDLARLADVPFTITSKTTGESHTVISDKNGYVNTASSWNKHTTNTNRGETSEDGIWFGTSEPNDEKGALLYDTYIVEEQRCAANEGMNLLKIEVTIYKDSVTVPMGTLTDDYIEIGTTALEKESGSHFAPANENLTLIDTVTYKGLKKGQDYKLVGTLMDKATGEALQVDGNPVTSEAAFTAKKAEGSVEVSFTFDASAVNGKTIVVFETLYQDDEELIVHADIEDSDQTIYFPEIGTTAKDADTDSQISCADDEVTLVDTVSFKNLMPQKEYQVIGTLMNKETGKAIEIEGTVLTASTTFTPEGSDGSVDVTFTFDGSALKGKTVVVFESLVFEQQEIAIHADLEDAGQTIYFPEVKTIAKDSDTKNHCSLADSDVTIIDTIEYTNLIPGEIYHVTGTLMDKASGEAFQIDGVPITAQTDFTPETSAGNVELSFTFDGSSLKGQTLVVFESVTYKEKEVAVHANLEDADQTIYFPEVKTSAKDGEDNDQKALADKDVKLIDTVSYKNLIPGANYKVYGILMDKATGKSVAIDGKQITAEAAFTAESSEGSVEITFQFDGTTLAGHDVVIFEKLFFVEGETETKIASHEDLEDKDQTITLTEVPKEETPRDTTSVSPSVKTGDNAQSMFYLVLAVSALLFTSILGIALYKKRKHQNTEDTK
ncbi:MAG: VaFE repeat-containing surface-anchored protein [Lachnospiraceae bacterium]|nr:VaFE repeat-containing surface-anchored protein [Lachnospiraceae bacterium]